MRIKYFFMTLKSDVSTICFSELSKLDLYRYADPVRGPRTLPPLPADAMIKLQEGDKFAFGATGELELRSSAASAAIGDQLIYADPSKPLA